MPAEPGVVVFPPRLHIRGWLDSVWGVRGPLHRREGEADGATGGPQIRPHGRTFIEHPSFVWCTAAFGLHSGCLP